MAKKKKPKRRKAETAIRKSRSELDSLMDRGVIPATRTIWDASNIALVRQLRRRMKGRSRKKLTQPEIAMLGRAAKPVLLETYLQIVDRVAEGTEAALTRGVFEIEAFMGTVEGAAGRLPDAMDTIITRHEARLAQARALTAAHLALSTDAAIKKALLRLKVDQDSLSDALDVVGETADKQWWQVDRVIRTETAHAYATSSAEAILVLQEDYPDLMKRWTEMVSDTTKRPLDNRVAPDSIAMHGQLAAPTDPFTMPAGAPGVSARLLGRQWYHPPNRPNDRAVVVPWRREWGVPGWLYRGGRRVRM